MVASNGSLIVSAIVENTGSCAGTEIVQLYVRDMLASVTRPVKELKGFQHISLEPGQSQSVRFDVPAQKLGFWGIDMRYIVEPGSYKLWIGPDSTGGLEGTFTLSSES